MITRDTVTIFKVIDADTRQVLFDVDTREAAENYIREENLFTSALVQTVKQEWKYYSGTYYDPPEHEITDETVEEEYEVPKDEEEGG